MKSVLCVLTATVLVAAAARVNHQPQTSHSGRDPEHPRIDRANPKIAGEDKVYWYDDGQTALLQRLGVTPQVAQAKNIVLFLGDGMSLSSVTAGRNYKGQGTGLWEREKLLWETFPYTAMLKTYSTDSQVPDSACASTAYLGGVKANYGTIGVDQNVVRNICSGQDNPAFQVDSVAKQFVNAGKSAGLVTNTRVTHGTPAGVYAHVAERHWETDNMVSSSGEDPTVCDDIAEQLVLRNPGQNLKVILGGGRQSLVPDTVVDVESGEPGLRTDGQDLIQAWQQQKLDLGASAAYVWNKNDLLAVDTNNTDYLLGLFSYSHMDYVQERDPTMDPTLAEMTRAAIEVLQRDPSGYFLLVEGGMIDQAHHFNWALKAMAEMMELDDAVGVALQMTNPDDTLVVVTADHGTSLTLNGYAPRNSNIMGMAGVSDIDSLPYSTLMYSTGPGFQVQEGGVRPDLGSVDTTDPNFYYPATVPVSSAPHAGEDVGVWATGPHSHLFSGVYEQSYLAHALSYAACVGQGLTFCGAT